MAYPENNAKNRFELATNVVDTWSLEDLRDYVMNELESDYRNQQDYFESTWDDYKTSFEWSEELHASVKKDCPNPGCCCGMCEKQDDENWKTKDALEGRR